MQILRKHDLRDTNNNVKSHRKLLRSQKSIFIFIGDSIDVLDACGVHTRPLENRDRFFATQKSVER